MLSFNEKLKLMKNIIKLLSILSFLFIAQNINGQTNPVLISSEKGMYLYDGQHYWIKQLRPILASNREALWMHKKLIRNRRVHRVLTLGSSAAIVRWAIWNSKRVRCSDPNVTCHDPQVITQLYNDFISGIVLTVTTVAIVGSGIPLYIKKKKVIKIYNEGVTASMKTGSIPLHLNFKTTNNGVGLVLNF